MKVATDKINRVLHDSWSLRCRVRGAGPRCGPQCRLKPLIMLVVLAVSFMLRRECCKTTVDHVVGFVYDDNGETVEAYGHRWINFLCRLPNGINGTRFSKFHLKWHCSSECRDDPGPTTSRDLAFVHNLLDHR